MLQLPSSISYDRCTRVEELHLISAVRPLQAWLKNTFAGLWVTHPTRTQASVRSQPRTAVGVRGWLALSALPGVSSLPPSLLALLRVILPSLLYSPPPVLSCPKRQIWRFRRVPGY